MLRSIFLWSRPPLLREGGEYACFQYHHANETGGPPKPAHPSPLRSSACVKRNLDSSAHAGASKMSPLTGLNGDAAFAAKFLSWPTWSREQIASAGFARRAGQFWTTTRPVSKTRE